MKVSIFAAVFGLMIICVFSSVEAQSKTCNLKEVDMCLTNFYYDQKNIPTNEKQLRKTCSSTRTLHKCLSVYFKRCMSAPLSLMNPFLETCQKPSGDPMRTEIFKYSKCLNANSKKIQTCSSSTRDTFFYILEESYERRIPILCCNAKKVSQCTKNMVTDLCDKDHADFQSKYNQGSEVLNMICEHYDPNGDSCKGYFVPDGWKSSEDSKSPLSRMINAFF
ncbi:hypothetical protein BLOT_004945 [Blomia tropicalis]|nr:hypothetical protein BLOT_004945 [Blomia tropicalis]